MTDERAAQWTRRRFLRTAGGAVVAAVSLGALAYEAVQWTTAGPPPAGSSPGLTGVRSAGRAPASPRISGAPAAGRPGFHSRPDLTPPAITVDSPPGAVAPGLVFLTPNNGADSDGPTIVDNAGDLVWMLPVPGKHVTDFRVATYRGQPVLVWWEGTVNGGIGSGECVIVDTSYREVARVRAANGRSIDLHEFQLTPQGTALFFADAGVRAPVPAGSSPPPWQVLDCAIQEVDVETGTLLWEWHTADHIGLDETYVQPPASGNSLYDYVHANSIELEPAGTLLVSARNTSAVYRIDRSSGAIVWRLGGRRSDFRFGPGATFGWQHDLRRQADGTLTLFDDESPPVPARALVLRVDEAAHTVQLVRAYTRPQANLVASQGNVQTLANGNVFVGWGSTPFCSEFERDGRLVFDATFPGAVQSYRDFRFEWTAEPVDVPAVAVGPSSPGAGPVVYASWNGATEVARWDVLAGPDNAHMEPAASVPRSGFETAIALGSRPSLVAVHALDAAGRVLGVSATVNSAVSG
jgi:Arylsulfotransferase (ASST)